MSAAFGAAFGVVLVSTLGPVARDAGRACGTPLRLGWKEWVALYACAAAAGGVAFALGALPHRFATVPGTAAALLCALTDLQTGYIFDRVLVWAGIVVVAMAFAQGDLSVSAGGAIGGALIPFLLHVGTRGRGMGFGDVKLAALIGASEDARGGMLVFLVAAVAAALVATALLIARRRTLGDTLAFGPFLAFGACIVPCIPNL